MKINIGISDLEEIPILAKKGAKEFHCGIITTYSQGMINYRPNTGQSNLKDFYELKEAIALAHKHNCKIFFLINSPTYQIDKYANILNEMAKIKEAGIDGFVMSSLSLIFAAKHLNANIHLSSTQPVFNSKAIEFVKRLGISRVILPQHINYKEIKKIIENTEIELECFFLEANFCKYIDGNCLFHNKHLYKKEKDYSKYSSFICKLDFKTNNPEIKNNYKTLLDSSEPVLSCLYHNIKNGIGTLKLGVRSWPLSKKVEMLGQLNQLIGLMHNNEEDFIKKGLKLIDDE